MFVDSHCHLDDLRFQEDFQETLKRAEALNVKNMLTISTLLSEVPVLEKISSTYSNIFHSVGVHPNEVEKEGIPTAEQLKTLCSNPKAIGIGETGLDYYYEHTNRKEQQISFRNHIQASLETKLPLIIHSRNAEDDIINILKEHSLPQNPGVIHCFTGTQKFADQALSLGFYISISGIVTFKNAENLKKIAFNIPLDRLLIETDAPYLAPMPYRGKRNEPSFVVHTAEALAVLKNMSTQDLGQTTTQNFFNLFSKALRC